MKKNGCMPRVITVISVRKNCKIPVPHSSPNTEEFLEDRVVMDRLIIMN